MSRDFGFQRSMGGGDHSTGATRKQGMEGTIICISGRKALE